jgi:hypothetical protein
MAMVGYAAPGASLATLIASFSGPRASLYLWSILDVIYETEQKLNSDSPAGDTAPEPVDLSQLQRDLRPSELFVEYVLDAPQSYALAVTHQTVHRYALPPKDELEREATRYRTEILQQRTDLALAEQLFNGLLGGMCALAAEPSVLSNSRFNPVRCCSSGFGSCGAITS